MSWSQSETVVSNRMVGIRILGEDHNSDKLSKSVLSILQDAVKDKQKVCFFMEVPNDFQADFDRAIRQRNLSLISKPLLDDMLSGMVKVYRKLGKDTQELERETKRLSTNNALPSNYALDGQGLNFISENKISLIVYDVHSKSQDRFDGLYYQMLVEDFRMGTREDEIRQIKAMVRRNKIMGNNISNGIRAHGCKKNLVVIGYGHLIKESVLKQSGGIESDDHTYKNLQTYLKEQGFNSSVYIHQGPNGYAKAEWFDNFQFFDAYNWPGNR